MWIHCDTLNIAVRAYVTTLRATWVPREQLGGRRLRFTDDQRRRLAPDVRFEPEARQPRPATCASTDCGRMYHCGRPRNLFGPRDVGMHRCLTKVSLRVTNEIGSSEHLSGSSAPSASRASSLFVAVVSHCHCSNTFHFLVPPDGFRDKGWSAR